MNKYGGSRGRSAAHILLFNHHDHHHLEHLDNKTRNLLDNDYDGRALCTPSLTPPSSSEPTRSLLPTTPTHDLHRLSDDAQDLTRLPQSMYGRVSDRLCFTRSLFSAQPSSHSLECWVLSDIAWSLLGRLHVSPRLSGASTGRFSLSLVRSS